MSGKEKVFQYIDQHTDEIIDFLKEFIEYPSINYIDSNKTNDLEVQNWLAESLSLSGFKVDRWAEDSEGERPNVVGILEGRGNGRDLILNGHTDVVPVNSPEKWDYKPFEPVVVDGKLYGRGSSDMKGGCAAGFWALKALKDCGIKLDGNVFLELMVGEESNEGKTIGTVSAVKRGYRAPFAIVMEPTNLEIHLSSVSLFFFQLLIPGKSGHICNRNQAVFPQVHGVPSGHVVGVDALQKAAPFIDYFYRLENQWNHRWKYSSLGSGGHPGFDEQGVGVFTINPSLVEGGTFTSSLMDHLKLTYSVWHPYDVPGKTIHEEIKKAVAAIASTDDWLKENPPVLDIPAIIEWEGFNVSEELTGVRVLKEAYRDALNHEGIISGFKAVSDATYLNQHNINSIILGPGGLSFGVHGDNEFLPVDQLIKAVKVYASFIIDWCRGK